MHEKQTLHDYVYHHLREQIISGQRPYVNFIMLASVPFAMF